MKSAEIIWKEVLSDSSRICIDNACRVLIANPKSVNSLIDLGFSHDGSYSGRAIRTLTYALEINNKLFKKEIKSLLFRCAELQKDSLKFHFFKIFTLVDLPKNDLEIAELTNLCFDALIAKVDRIAIKVYAAEILYKIVLKYPDLKNELIEILKIQSEDAPPSLTSVSRRIIKSLKN
jgi:hypothetical protein